jgi:hypothetical protein
MHYRYNFPVIFFLFFCSVACDNSKEPEVKSPAAKSQSAPVPVVEPIRTADQQKETNPESMSEQISRSNTNIKTPKRADDSHCRVEGEKIPDGNWYGAVRHADKDILTFDLMCWFSGKEADLAAAEDGETDIPVPNDYYVRNRSKRVRTVPVAPSAQVKWLSNPGGPVQETISYHSWLKKRRDPEYINPGVRIDVVNGSVISINEVYTP